MKCTKSRCMITTLFVICPFYKIIIYIYLEIHINKFCYYLITNYDVYNRTNNSIRVFLFIGAIGGNIYTIFCIFICKIMYKLL